MSKDSTEAIDRAEELYTRVTSQTSNVTLNEAIEASRHLLGHYNYPGGYQGGSFTTNLISTWEKADSNNRARLALGFPDYELIINVFQHGNEVLQEFLKIAESKSR